MANHAMRGPYERLAAVLPPLARTAAETLVLQTSPLVEPLIKHIQVQNLARCGALGVFGDTRPKNIDFARGASSVKILPMCTKRTRSVRGILVRAPRADGCP